MATIVPDGPIDTYGQKAPEGFVMAAQARTSTGSPSGSPPDAPPADAGEGDMADGEGGDGQVAGEAAGDHEEAPPGSAGRVARILRRD